MAKGFAPASFHLDAFIIDFEKNPVSIKLFTKTIPHDRINAGSILVIKRIAVALDTVRGDSFAIAPSFCLCITDTTAILADNIKVVTSWWVMKGSHKVKDFIFRLQHQLQHMKSGAK
jgi:hypothetical protein